MSTTKQKVLPGKEDVPTSVFNRVITNERGKQNLGIKKF